MTTHSFYRSEIQDRIQKGYLERLSKRLKKMRKLFVERNWQELRVECTHLKFSAGSFGFPSLAVLAEEAERAIPIDGASRAVTLPETRQSIENLFASIEQTLIANSIRT